MMSGDLWVLLEDTVIHTATPEVIDAGADYAVLGLMSEVGELASEYKKLIRNDDGIMTTERRENIKEEMGDILWYIQLLIIAEEFDPAELILMNRGKLFQRLKDDAIKERRIRGERHYANNSVHTYRTEDGTVQRVVQNGTDSEHYAGGK
jgi:NTP pyrophosphatase (non-canonical NTP hydrolase)